MALIGLFVAETVEKATEQSLVEVAVECEGLGIMHIHPYENIQPHHSKLIVNIA